MTLFMIMVVVVSYVRGLFVIYSPDREKGAGVFLSAAHRQTWPIHFLVQKVEEFVRRWWLMVVVTGTDWQQGYILIVNSARWHFLGARARASSVSLPATVPAAAARVLILSPPACLSTT